MTTFCIIATVTTGIAVTWWLLHDTEPHVIELQSTWLVSGIVYGGKLVAGAIKRSPILIYASRYWIGWSGNDLVSSGCITEPLSWWLENVERCGEEHDYTPEEQREYRMHVEHIAAWMRLYGYTEKQENPAA